MAQPATTTDSRTPATREVSKWIDGLYCSRRRRTPGFREAMKNVQNAMWNRARVKGTCDDREWDRISMLADTFGYEVFASLYDRDAAKPLDRPAPDTGWMELAHTVVDGLPQIAGTSGDPDMAAIATGRLLEAMVPALNKLMDQADEAQDEQNGGGGGGGGLGSGKPGNGSPVDGTDVARALMRRAADKATQEVQDIKEQMNNLEPGLGDAPPTHGQLDTRRMDLAGQLNDNESIQKALALAGVLRRCAEATRERKDPRGKSHVYGLEIGNDLGRVLPQELAGLSNPKLRMLTLSRYAERTLQQYRLEGTERQGRGPIVIMIDSSGSMRGDEYLYATAMAIAAVGMAAREGRACTVISFARRIKWVIGIGSDGMAWERDRDVSGARREPRKIGGGSAEVAMRIASSRPDGGTDFEAPLRYALDMRDGLADDRSDLVLVTDGYADVPEDIMDRLGEAKDAGMKMWGFTVGGGSLGAAVQTLCDTTLDIDQATDEEIGRAMA